MSGVEPLRVPFWSHLATLMPLSFTLFRDAKRYSTTSISIHITIATSM